MWCCRTGKHMLWTGRQTVLSTRMTESGRGMLQVNQITSAVGVH